MLEGLISSVIKVGSMVSLINEYNKDKEKEKIINTRKRYNKKTLFLDRDEFDEDELRIEKEKRYESEVDKSEEEILKKEEVMQLMNNNILENSNTISAIHKRMNKTIGIIICIMLLAICFVGSDYEWGLLFNKSLSTSSILCILIIFICFVLLIWKIYEKVRYEKYIQQIIIHNERDINVIARRVNVSIEKVVNDVSYLAIRGYIVHCFVDKKRNKIIINKEKSSISDNVNLVMPVKKRCEGCGAINSFDYDLKHVCKYCGRVLE